MLKFYYIFVEIFCSFCTWILLTISTQASQINTINLSDSNENIQVAAQIKSVDIDIQQYHIYPIELEIRDAYLTNEHNSLFDLSTESNREMALLRKLHPSSINDAVKFEYTFNEKTNKFNNNLSKFPPLFSLSNHSIIRKKKANNNSLNKFKKRLIVAPNNFNPGQKLPSLAVPKLPKLIQPQKNINRPIKSVLLLENIQTNFRDDFNKFNQNNSFIEPTFHFRLPNKQKMTFKTGFNTFEQPKYDKVINIPLQFGWHSKIEKFTIHTAVGIDIFNRLPIALNFNLQVDRPMFINLTPNNKLTSGLFLAAIVEYGPYKSSTQSLENLIVSTRTGLNAYWQIKRDMSFFTLYRVGFYNDGNFEQQSFNRIEHKLGEFYIAANVFAWTFNRDRQQSAGYFSPKNFLVYNLEAGWEKQIFDFLNCRLNANLGRQMLNGISTSGTIYQARCAARILPNVNLDLGYVFSNSRELDTGNTPYNNRNLSGQLQIKF